MGNSAFGLADAIWISMATAAAIAAWRWLRNQALQPAVSGVLGVAVSAAIAVQVDSAKGFFLMGIWTSLIAAVVFAVSVVIGWPLVGVIWHGLTGGGQRWQQDKPTRSAFTLATLALTVVFASRFVVQQWLYTQDSVGWLVTARIVMGYPLSGATLLVVIWAVRRSQRRISPHEPATAANDPGR
ncbi:putative integral membrane alanine and leucine rich protein [Mycobacteroides abscessus subsp. massiliense]|nr:putative integral membrane alanine and leucine rich protein [Mycobacteroides abscessus subsp. massiliense]